MSEHTGVPRIHTANLDSGQEFETVRYKVSREMVDFWLIGIDDRHEWYVSESPFGGPVAPPVMCNMAAIRIRVHHLWGDFVGAVFTKPANVFYIFNAEYFDPIRVGETITVKGRCSANYLNRGRRFVDFVTEVFGEDGRLCSRAVSTSLTQYKKEGE